VPLVLLGAESLVRIALERCRQVGNRGRWSIAPGPAVKFLLWQWLPARA
jgi:hypothetical protein